jgi:3-hydroxyacyl-[acyl-carrier-protein] dehydratase
MTDVSPLLPWHIAPDHPVFAGHFPDHPIVPGALLLDEALQCLARAEHLTLDQIEVAVAKFLQPVKPGEPVALRYRPSGPQRFALEVLVGQASVVATATVNVLCGHEPVPSVLAGGA